MSNCNCASDCGVNCKCKDIFTAKEKEIIAKSAMLLAKGDIEKALKLISSERNIKDTAKQAQAKELILLIDRNYKAAQATEITANTLLPLTSYLWARSQYKQLGSIMNKISAEEREQVLATAHNLTRQKSFLERVFERVHD